MSALPPKADIRRRSWDVRFVPSAGADTRKEGVTASGCEFEVIRFHRPVLHVQQLHRSHYELKSEQMVAAIQKVREAVFDLCAFRSRL
jgi:hypothetical protein